MVVSTEEGMAHDNVLPIEFAEFDKMCAEGDTLFVGRYLTNGADVSSVYMDVSDFHSISSQLALRWASFASCFASFSCLSRVF